MQAIPSLLLATSTAVLLPFCPVAAFDDDCDDADPPDTVRARWEAMFAAMGILEGGVRGEKVALFVDAVDTVDGPFDDLWPPPGCDEQTAQSLINRLRSWARREPDAWVLDLAAGNIAYWGIDEALPLFRDLSRHAAPSVRARAVEQATEMGDEEAAHELLMEMWEREKVPWVQARLLIAIAGVDYDFDVSGPPYDRCVALIEHEDPDLAKAAIECAWWIDHPGTDEALLRRVEGTGSSAVRLAALWVLQQRLGKLEAVRDLVRPRLEALWARELPSPLRIRLLDAMAEAAPELSLEWSRESVAGEDGPLARAALFHLADSSDARDATALLGRAVDGPEEVRAFAISLLEQAELTLEVQAILATSLEPSEPTAVRRAAVDAIDHGLPQGWEDFQLPEHIRELWSEISAGREALAPLLERVAREDPDSSVRESALAALGQGKRVEPMDCEVATDNVYVLATAGPESSLRCWAGPGLERAPENVLRVAAGSRVLRSRRFDDGRAEWWSFLHNDDLCWLPARSFRSLQSEEGLEHDPDTTVHEFDLPLDIASTAPFLALEQAGVATRFDEGTSLTGMRFNLEALDEETRALLSKASALVTGPLLPEQATIGQQGCDRWVH